LKAVASKAIRLVRVSGVRILLSPPFLSVLNLSKNGETSSKIRRIFDGSAEDTSPTKIANQFWRGGSAIGSRMCYVYILLNEAKTRTYTGVADNVNKRLELHNAGRVKASRPYRPYNIIHTERFETLKEARQKEKFYKSTTGRRRIKEMFFSQRQY
jgi:putative endonuclease